jgi:hypothetical protein
MSYLRPFSSPSVLAISKFGNVATAKYERNIRAACTAIKRQSLIYICVHRKKLALKYILIDFYFLVYVEASPSCNDLVFTLGSASPANTVTIPTRSWQIKVNFIIYKNSLKCHKFDWST